MASPTPYRQIRALYDETTVTVYQAYKSTIAEAAVSTQKLNASPDFRPGRMTWIKPSWCWMMYRAGYSFKDPGQSRILALRMRREDFLGLLGRAVLSSDARARGGAGGDDARRRGKSADVRVQWDPERTPGLHALPYRSIQVGIPGALSEIWAKEWIVEIEDVTDRARELKRMLDQRPDVTIDVLIELGLIPVERPLPVPESIEARLEMSASAPRSET